MKTSSQSQSRWIAGTALGALALWMSGCRSTPAEPEVQKETKPAVSATKPATSKPNTAQKRTQPNPRTVAAKPVAQVPVSPDDPIKGKFSLEDAAKGLAGDGPLVAEIKTSKGNLTCELYQDKAPITVANFVGLARGLRPWKTPKGEWVKRPGYDGTTFHRVIKGFMIQGGDPAGTGAGEPGYVIPDEIWAGAAHNQRGQLCMANRGANTNAMQFFIMDGVAAHLDGGYTIFGKCGPDSVVETLANVPTKGERPVEPVKITQITVKRGPKTEPSAAPGSSSASPLGSGAPVKSTGPGTSDASALGGNVGPGSNTTPKPPVGTTPVVVPPRTTPGTPAAGTMTGQPTKPPTPPTNTPPTTPPQPGH